MSAVLDFLKAFNRKERYILLTAALGSFDLSDPYRHQLGDLLALDVPPDAYVAMDYHLTWLYASVSLAAKGFSLATAQSEVFANETGAVSGNQEDIDLLVAYDVGPQTHIIIIEAKGVTGWTNKQMASKAARLRQIFGDARAEQADVIPHFVLTSPKRSENLSSADWPVWMQGETEVAWMPLPIPGGLIRVSRADESGRASATGSHWRVFKESSSPRLEP